MQLPNTFKALVDEALALNLYTKLIHRLNKDLSFGNIDLEFDKDTLPTSLKLILQDLI